MSTDTDWLDELLVKLTCGLPDPEVAYGDRWGEFVARNKGIPKIKEAKATILQHESQAVKAADKAGRIEELDDLSVVAQYWHQEGLATEPYEMIAGRIQQLQGDSTGATPPIIDHRTDMEL